MSNKEDYNHDLIGIEFHKMKLLKQFEQFCADMKNDEFNSKVRNFYRNTPNPVDTSKSLFRSKYRIELDDAESVQLTSWIMAHLRKKPYRKQLPIELKKELWLAQNGKCNICGCNLGDDYSTIHVDHIIPWVLVGDELPDNYQDLCQTCNTKKNKSVDYRYKVLVGLV